MSEFNQTIPYGVAEAGRPKTKYYPSRVTKKNVRGIPGMDLTIQATVNSPKTSRAVRRSMNGAFGKESLLSSEFNL